METVDDHPDLEDVVRRAMNNIDTAGRRRPESVRVRGPETLRVVAKANLTREVALVWDAGEADAARTQDFVLG